MPAGESRKWSKSELRCFADAAVTRRVARPALAAWSASSRLWQPGSGSASGSRAARECSRCRAAACALGRSGGASTRGAAPWPRDRLRRRRRCAGAAPPRSAPAGARGRAGGCAPGCGRPGRSRSPGGRSGRAGGASAASLRRLRGVDLEHRLDPRGGHVRVLAARARTSGWRAARSRRDLPRPICASPSSGSGPACTGPRPGRRCRRPARG